MARARPAGEPWPSQAPEVLDKFRENGHWKIQGYSCPLSSVTARDGRVCGLAESLVRRTTGAEVKEVCQRGWRSRCAFEISFPAESES